MSPSKRAAFAFLVTSVAALVGCGEQPITAAQLAAEANKRAAFPQDLGDGFRLDSITAEGNVVVSTVTFTNTALSSDPAFAELMRAATTSDFCRELAPAKAAYSSAGIALARVFKDAKGSQIVRVDVKPADCP